MGIRLGIVDIFLNNYDQKSTIFSNENLIRVDFSYINNPDKVCRDNFDTNDAYTACRNLGYDIGSFEIKKQSKWSVDEIPILMDETECEPSSTNFLDCAYKSQHDCDHNENVLVKCKKCKFSMCFYL